MKQSADIDILWGSYYVSQEEGSEEFSLFRLLDFNRDAYHAALFNENFLAIPSLDKILSLVPFVGHAPIDASGLLNANIQLVGGAPLTSEDLQGYMLYLEYHDLSADQRRELTERLISCSYEPPLHFALHNLLMEEDRSGISHVFR